MNQTTSISKTKIAQDFRSATQGKLAEDKIANVERALTATVTSYPAQGSVVSFIFYAQVQLHLDNGKTFDSKAGGLFTPGGGALFGDVYTEDLQRLCDQTVSFEFQSTPVYLSVLFFDNNHNLLGHFQGGAVSIVTGVGGGSGSWS